MMMLQREAIRASIRFNRSETRPSSSAALLRDMNRYPAGRTFLLSADGAGARRSNPARGSVPKRRRHIGIRRFRGAGEKWRDARGSGFPGNGFTPFFRIREFWIHVEDDPAEGEEPVLDHLADLEFRVLYLCHTHATLFSSPRDKLKSAATGNSVSLMCQVVRKSG